MSCADVEPVYSTGWKYFDPSVIDGVARLSVVIALYPLGVVDQSDASNLISHAAVVPLPAS